MVALRVLRLHQACHSYRSNPRRCRRRPAIASEKQASSRMYYGATFVSTTLTVSISLVPIVNITGFC
jgi:hypothetical protein